MSSSSLSIQCIDLSNGLPSGSVVKNQPAMQKPQEIQFRSLGCEDSLEEEMATYSSIHAWKIPRTEETGRLQPMELQKSRTPLVTIQQQYSFVKMGEHFQFSLVAQSCPNLCDP